MSAETERRGDAGNGKKNGRKQTGETIPISLRPARSSGKPPLREPCISNPDISCSVRFHFFYYSRKKGIFLCTFRKFLKKRPQKDVSGGGATGRCGKRTEKRKEANRGDHPHIAPPCPVLREAPITGAMYFKSRHLLLRTIPLFLLFPVKRHFLMHFSEILEKKAKKRCQRLRLTARRNASYSSAVRSWGK